MCWLVPYMPLALHMRGRHKVPLCGRREHTSCVKMMLRAGAQRLSIPVAPGASQRRLLSSALRPPQRLLARGARARGAEPSSSALQSQRRLLSDSTNALSHYKRERLLEKIGFGIHNSRRDARRLRLGALRSLASPRTRTTHLTVLHRAYGVLEACLDAQVAALDTAPAPEGELEDFSSLQGVAAQFWKEHGDGLRRAPALAAALKADRPETVELGEELFAEEHYWSPAVWKSSTPSCRRSHKDNVCRWRLGP